MANLVNGCDLKSWQRAQIRQMFADADDILWVERHDFAVDKLGHVLEQEPVLNEEVYAMQRIDLERLVPLEDY